MSNHPEDKTYNEASVPTPRDQEDVSAIDNVEEAVEEVIDDLQKDIGLEDKPPK